MRFVNPGNWGALWSKGRGRSEMAAQLYDEILFHGATFADLDRGIGPLIIGHDLSQMSTATGKFTWQLVSHRLKLRIGIRLQFKVIDAGL